MTGMVEEPGSAPGPTVPGNITRLNPKDGLFLRGEHLGAIQGYARDLVRAVGAGGGSGVVYGYTVTLDGDKLRVGPGLAIDPDGRPLRSDAEAVVQLKDPPAMDSSGNGFLVVEVGPAEWPSGHEKVYGELCGDGCSGSGAGIRPWIGEGITVELVPRTIEGFNTVSSALRRNRLASLYFDQERRKNQWLRPDSGQPVNPITGWNWYAGVGAADPAHVPIAALLAVDGKWVLDVWTARRDRDGPSAKSVWQTRLCMRPWSVFMAQILQFQAQLASHAAELNKLEVAVETIAEVKPLEEFAAQATLTLTNAQKAQLPPGLQAAAAAAAARLPFFQMKAGQSLVQLGFEELPPAGYLPVPKATPDVQAAVLLMLGNHLDLRFRPCSVDYVPQAVEEAQHRDRIPLTEPKPYPTVDILVPGTPGPRPAGGYGWVAFVRRVEVDAEEVRVAGDQVHVYFHKLARLGNPANLRLGMTAKIQSEKFLATLTYPRDGWAYPGAPESEQITSKLATLTAGLSVSTVYLVGLAKSAERRPLLALRSSLLATTFESGLPTPAVHTFVAAPSQQEAIVIIVA
jgi:hypothetical protein